jgi:hypothetical protein
VPECLRRGERASPGVTPTEAEGSRLGTRNALSGRGLTAPAKRLAGMTKSEDRMTNQTRNLPACGGSE